MKNLINSKATKQQLIEILKSSKVKDKNLAERIKYALGKVSEDMRKVTKEDLIDLVSEITTANVKTAAPVEASVKPKKPQVKSKDKAEEKSEPVKEEKTEKTTKTEKVKKPVPKKKEEVLTAQPTTTLGADNKPFAKYFPDEIDHKDFGKLVACKDRFTTYKEILDALNKDKTLYFACYWTKKQIKEFSYSYCYRVPAPKDGFPNDLDISTAVIPCESIDRLYTMSSYTEALYMFEGSEGDFNYVEDTDPTTGEKFKVRISNGMEYEIYCPADEIN